MEIVTIALVSVGGIAVCALAHVLATSRNRVASDADDEPGIAKSKRQTVDMRASRTAVDRDEPEPIDTWPSRVLI